MAWGPRYCALTLCGGVESGVSIYCICLTTEEFKFMCGHKPKYTRRKLRNVDTSMLPEAYRESLQYVTKHTFAIKSREQIMGAELRAINEEYSAESKRRKHCVVICTLPTKKFLKDGEPLPIWSEVQTEIASFIRKAGKTAEQKDRAILLIQCIRRCRELVDQPDNAVNDGLAPGWSDDKEPSEGRWDEWSRELVDQPDSAVNDGLAPVWQSDDKESSEGLWDEWS